MERPMLTGRADSAHLHRRGDLLVILRSDLSSEARKREGGSDEESALADSAEQILRFAQDDSAADSPLRSALRGRRRGGRRRRLGRLGYLLVRLDLDVDVDVVGEHEPAL